MTSPGVLRDRRAEAPLAVLIGCYGALVALAPSVSARIALAAPLAAIPLFLWTMAGAGRWIGLFLASALLLPPLPIALGDSGPHPALAAAAIGVLAGLARARQWRLSFEPVAVMLAAFCCVLLSSAGLAAFYSGTAIAAASLARVGLFGIGVYVYVYVAHGPGAGTADPMRSARWLFFAGVGSGIFACVDFYYQLPAPAGYGAQYVWLDVGVLRRAQGLFYEASTLGNCCAFFLVMIAVSLVRPPAGRPVSRALLLAGGVILATALIFSYSRASLLNVVVSLGALAYVRGLRVGRMLLVAAIVAAFGALAVYALFPSFALSYWLRLSASVEYFWSSPEGVLSGRLASWRTLVSFLAEHPWHALAGVGYKTLPYSDFVGRTVIADNMYLSLLVETGALGLGIFLLLCRAILRAGLGAARGGTPAAAFFGTWIFCFWAGQMVQMLSGDLMTYWRVVPVYLWVLGIAVRETRAAAG